MNQQNPKFIPYLTYWIYFLINHPFIGHCVDKLQDFRQYQRIGNNIDLG